MKILAGIMIAIVIELMAGHLLLHLWSPIAAWIHTAIGLYGTLWLIGDYRAMRFRPIRLSDGALHIRCGLRWSVHVPLSEIAAIEPAGRRHANEEGYLDASPSWSPRQTIRLKHPVVAEGPYGIRKNVQVLGIQLDEPDRLRNALPL